MRVHDLARYGLWCGVLATAEGNRREYHMTTTWLPHLATNTLSLLLPDVYRLLDRRHQLTNESHSSLAAQLQHTLGGTLRTLLCDRPDYALYVAPLALGYILSSPWFNIYKGELAEKQLAGFGLDALPHGATAFALTALLRDTARTFGEQAQHSPDLGPSAGWIERHQVALSAAILALVTLLWELGEYRIYKHEMGQRGHAENINMQWSATDTAFDCASNAIGWLLATVWSTTQRDGK